MSDQPSMPPLSHTSQTASCATGNGYTLAFASVDRVQLIGANSSNVFDAARQLIHA